MGGFFSSPSPPPPPTPAPDPEAAARDERIKLLARRRRGRAGLIATSERGALAPGALAPLRKSLLGE